MKISAHAAVAAVPSEVDDIFTQTEEEKTSAEDFSQWTTLFPPITDRLNTTGQRG